MENLCSECVWRVIKSRWLWLPQIHFFSCFMIIWNVDVKYMQTIKLCTHSSFILIKLQIKYNLFQFSTWVSFLVAEFDISYLSSHYILRFLCLLFLRRLFLRILYTQILFNESSFYLVSFPYVCLACVLLHLYSHEQNVRVWKKILGEFHCIQSKAYTHIAQYS